MPEAKATQPVQSQASASSFGRDEMNLSEFPLSLLTDSAKPGQQTLYFQSPQGTLTVTGSSAYGLPTATDSDVLVALLSLTKYRNDFTDAKVNFSRYELIKLLGWPDKGGSYKRLEQSFHRWSGVLLVYDKCWYDKKRKKYISANMHIIESAFFSDADSKADDDDDSPLSSFTWGQVFIDSCRAGNLRLLDLKTYLNLKHSSAKQLYRFLGKRFYSQSDLTFDLKELAFERVGLSREHADAGKIKEKLQPAITELESIGFIEPLPRAERYQKIEKGKWTVRLHQKPPALAPATASPCENTLELFPSTPPLNPLVAGLVNRGVTESTALALVDAYPAERIGAKIEHFDFLMATKPPKRPSGYLVTSIKSGYAAPDGFVSQDEQERQKAARAAAEQKTQDARILKARAQAEEQAAENNARARLAAMTPEERQAIQAAALQAAGEESRQTIEHLNRQKPGGGDGFLMRLTLTYLQAQADSELSAESV